MPDAAVEDQHAAGRTGGVDFGWIRGIGRYAHIRSRIGGLAVAGSADAANGRRALRMDGERVSARLTASYLCYIVPLKTCVLHRRIGTNRARRSHSIGLRACSDAGK